MAKIFKADGLDYDGSKFVNKQITLNLEGSVTTTGEPITLQAARAMTDGYLQPIISRYKTLVASLGEKSSDTDITNEIDSLLDANISVFYGKETLLLLLSQPDCEGIRFYFCKNHKDKQSLVLVGIDSNERDLGLPDEFKTIIDPDLKSFPEGVLAEEVGGPNTLRDYLSGIHELVEDPVGEALNKRIKI
ncbi:hypothetical protein [Spirosoma koreense]